MAPEDRLGREHTRTDEPDRDAARPHEFWRFLIVAAWPPSASSSG